MLEGAPEDGLGVVFGASNLIMYTPEHVGKKTTMKSCYRLPWNVRNDNESTTSYDASSRGPKCRSTSTYSLYIPHVKTTADPPAL